MTRDMPLVFETFLERLSQSIDEADFRDAMAEAAGRLDLIFFAYLSLPARPSGKPRLISNYPTRWTRQYLENQYEKLDPVVLRARNGGRPFHWGSNLGGDKMSPAQQQLFDEAAQFSICCGLTIPIVDLRGRIAAVTFAADEPRPVFLRVAERYEQALQLMAACFHRCVRRKLPSDRTVDGISLTSREYECLRWAARGNSAWVTGRILGIKPRTIAFHLDNAKKKLGVRTQNQAIALLGSEGSSIL
ncbi:LuxR family transcriptional regulator [Mesorhizobium sp. M6A.T.Ce.TU.016.01.1.1]|uniref:LuxR family transcriptional regulator n=1 Tax=Mesorhizobium sp. M6A.T.Ce.TU.016.01.1.1 TaxID=2496783 RepID=UPI000FCBFACE|nr:LuxR family transcriptional regulator [Mesorhizobium sp. M6A.T.Ce.TU.016.01.1.1]RUU25538.1 LuxR family transcriptional regulator [Mesorhizobium sp. M6A.T.Ce.TU.016.01.1.1]